MSSDLGGYYVLCAFLSNFTRAIYTDPSSANALAFFVCTAGLLELLSAGRAATNFCMCEYG